MSSIVIMIRTSYFFFFTISNSQTAGRILLQQIKIQSIKSSTFLVDFLLLLGFEEGDTTCHHIVSVVASVGGLLTALGKLLKHKITVYLFRGDQFAFFECLCYVRLPLVPRLSRIVPFHSGIPFIVCPLFFSYIILRLRWFRQS